MVRVLVVTALAAAPVVADWPQFRGPNGSAVAGTANPPTEWAADTNVVWKTPLPGPGASSPVVVADKVFVTCFSGYGTSPTDLGDVAQLVRHLVCVNRVSGKVEWTADVPGVAGEDEARGFLADHGYASHTPAADAAGVYGFFGKSGVVAFDHAGKKRWQTSVGTESDPRRWGSGASVLLHKNLVIVNAASESQSVRALDKTTGKEVWKAEGKRLSLSFSTPALVPVGDRTDLVVALPGEVWGLDPDAGTMRWFATVKADGNVSPSVVAGDGVAYLTGGFTGKATTAVKCGGKGDVTATHVLWSSRQSSYVPTPVLHGGRLHWVNEDGLAVALDAATGKAVYEERLPVKGGGGLSRPFYASAVIAGDRLYAPSRKGGVYVLAAGPAYKLLATNTLGDPTDFNATPAVDGDRLLLRSNAALYCVGK